MTSHPLYAVIDLGSNSFHMLITRLVADSVQVVDKVKRKVRLASGLNEDNELNKEAISRGLECLSFFAERLQDIPKENIRIVATATLRIATNADKFIQQANSILNNTISVLSGLEEAQYIYLGVAHTSYCNKKRLVLDIGGASTEIITGDGFTPHMSKSLNLGCVTYLQHYFCDGKLTAENFEKATMAAKQVISPVVNQFNTFDWQVALGGSGTMQALAEILLHRNLPTVIDLPFLLEIKQQLITCKEIENVKISGLRSERSSVLASGLAILIALFKCFDIQELQLSSGAIREGLLYEMLPDMRKLSIRRRTVQSLSERFHIDLEQACRVKKLAIGIYTDLTDDWQLKQDNNYALLKTACQLYEVGLLLDFKRNQQHGEYILKNADLPGFDQADRQLLTALVLLYKSDIEPSVLQHQSAADYTSALRLLIVLRLAIILCRRRQDDVLPPGSIKAVGKALELTLPKSWLAIHPLISDELKQEQQHLIRVDIELTIKSA